MKERVLPCNGKDIAVGLSLTISLALTARATDAPLVSDAHISGAHPQEKFRQPDKPGHSCAGIPPSAILKTPQGDYTIVVSASGNVGAVAEVHTVNVAVTITQ